MAAYACDSSHPAGKAIGADRASCFPELFPRATARPDTAGPRQKRLSWRYIRVELFGEKPTHNGVKSECVKPVASNSMP